MRFQLPHLILTFVIATVLAGGCQSHESGVTIQTLLEDEGPTSESWNPDMRINDGGVRRIHMKAAFMARYETPDSTYLVMSALNEESERVQVFIFDTLGDTSAVVTSQTITYFERQGRFVAEGDVIVEARAERWLFSEHLSWSDITSRIGTAGFATITTPTQTFSGYGLDADEDLNDFSLARVSGVVVIEDE